jgi:hypothetical protein
MLRNERLYLLPFGIRQVRGVSLSRFHTHEYTPLFGY